MKITTHLKPFTHKMGMPIVLPGAKCAVRLLPARIEVMGGECVAIPVTGPIAGFTTILDLEKGRVCISFTSQEGFIRYSLFAGANHPILQLEKGDITLPWQGKPQGVSLPDERLFFGVHKKLDWELVLRRQDPRELFPLWHRLGMMLPATSESGPSLLSSADDVESLMHLFSASFDGLMVPCLTDPHHQGFSLPSTTGEDPYVILSNASCTIRSLFFQELDGRITLPCPPFPSGRMLNVSTSLGVLSFEWSKWSIKKASFTCTSSGDLLLSLPKEVKRFRIKTGRRDKGCFLDAHAPLAVSEGDKLLLDRFEK